MGSSGVTHGTNVAEGAPHQSDDAVPTDNQSGPEAGGTPAIDAKHGVKTPLKLPEEWQVVGGNLRRASDKLQQDRQEHPGLYGHIGRSYEQERPVVSARDIDAEPEHMPGEGADSLHFLGSKNVRFWGNGARLCGVLCGGSR
ncbi:hypothetical protein ACIS_01073 [Anaplasma centrale str. Israel]|uniref:Uncharacterized protein n=1 Tax=Anaplasma centrale (strain Israel) TaxID=574556 RepID=D1ASU6_ANACI|nr:hypothetical protein [Anaplasma centrale]ACZ49549.1 hypothetical protein ACIS_01073 [Anaplasma centrale str. Israel]